ncbi:hypothetical protein [Sulfitobacter faviae]|uniref:hypothetical protein n=1 Tax=Sulfitobacter faviae TaxID=1775881 RepID=UPI00398D0720
MFGAITIHTVEPGTVIEYNGEKRTVTDEEVVYKGSHMYVTDKVYAAIKAQSKPTGATHD